jgi:hypothetical protein
MVKRENPFFHPNVHALLRRHKTVSGNYLTVISTLDLFSFFLSIKSGLDAIYQLAVNISGYFFILAHYQ